MAPSTGTTSGMLWTGMRSPRFSRAAFSPSRPRRVAPPIVVRPRFFTSTPPSSQFKQPDHRPRLVLVLEPLHLELLDHLVVEPDLLGAGDAVQRRLTQVVHVPRSPRSIKIELHAEGARRAPTTVLAPGDERAERDARLVLVGPRVDRDSGHRAPVREPIAEDAWARARDRRAGDDELDEKPHHRTHRSRRRSWRKRRSKHTTNGISSSL